MITRPADRVLVTGGAGFIGSHLAELLHQRGSVVTVLDDLSTGLLSNLEPILGRERFTFVQGSVLDRALTAPLVQAADVVFHLAAAVGVQLIVQHPLESMLSNIHGTENVLEAAARTGTRVLITSTSEIYGKSPKSPFNEEDDRLLGPTTRARWSYSTSKAVDEILALGYNHDRDLPVVVARLFNTVGPRQIGQYGMVLPRFINQALRGEPLTVYGDGTQSRVFTDVGDVVLALTLLMNSTAAEGEVFNVAGREEVTISSLARRVIERTASTSAIVHIPYVDAYGDGFEDAPRRVADISKLERLLGYRCETSLDSVIDRIIAHERNRTLIKSDSKEDRGDQVALSAVSS